MEEPGRCSRVRIKILNIPASWPEWFKLGGGGRSEGKSESLPSPHCTAQGFGDTDKPFLTHHYRDEVLVDELKQFVDVLQVHRGSKVVIILLIMQI